MTDRCYATRHLIPKKSIALAAFRDLRGFRFSASQDSLSRMPMLRKQSPFCTIVFLTCSCLQSPDYNKPLLPTEPRNRQLTIIVWPFTYENKGLATAKITLAASVAVPGLLSAISAYGLFPAASFCAFGIPRATFLPSGVVT